MSHLTDEMKYIHSVESIRPNFIISGGTQQAHQEDYWNSILISPTPSLLSSSGQDYFIDFRLTGPCPRCSMVNVNNTTGKYEPGILEAMSQYRKMYDRKIYFGQFAKYSESSEDIINDKSNTYYVEKNSKAFII